MGRFLDARQFRIVLPGLETRIVDVGCLHRDERWIGLRDRKEKALYEQIEADKTRARAVADHNRRAAEMNNLLRSRGLTCPLCGRHGTDIRYHPGTPEDRALFVCPGCGRSFGPDGVP